jgi:hypothetical protein
MTPTSFGRTILVALALVLSPGPAIAEASLTATEAREFSRDAYIYGYPMVDGYRILYAYFVARNHPEFKAPWNEVRNIPRVYTPEDRAVQTPNSDTPTPSSAPICGRSRSCSPCRRSIRAAASRCS